jgi:hypothetical protein
MNSFDSCSKSCVVAPLEKMSTKFDRFLLLVSQSSQDVCVPDVSSRCRSGQRVDFRRPLGMDIVLKDSNIHRCPT